MSIYEPMENPGAARLDRATEDALYALYRDYFETAENARRWSPWLEVPWDESFHPTDELMQAVVVAYREDLFLPDYSSKTLAALRASRGRAWFVTRWSYEKGKQMISLTEWLLRNRVYSDDALRELSDSTLTAYEWEPFRGDGFFVLAEMLAWEIQTLRRNERLHEMAARENDAALVTLLNWFLTDERAARTFFEAALNAIAIRHPEKIRTAFKELFSNSASFREIEVEIRNTIDITA